MRPHLLDLLVAVLVIVTVGFALAATLAASRQPISTPAGKVRLPPLQRSPAGRVRDVPVLTPGGAASRAVRDGLVLRDPEAMRHEISDEIDALFSPAAGARVARVVFDSGTLGSSLTNDGPDADDVSYPFHYNPPLDTLFQSALPATPSRRQVERANDLAALLILAAKRFETQETADPFPTSASVAYALLRQVRGSGGCRVGLNLAFLLSTDTNPRDDDTREEYIRVAEACPRDPTPLWLLGQFQSHRAYVPDGPGGDRAGTTLVKRDRLRRPFATFRVLQRFYPGSPAGWSGEGDTELRLAYQEDEARPFVARRRFRRALALYRRALALDPGSGELHSGEARALAGLRLHDEAVAAQERAVRATRGSTRLRVRLLDYLERAGRFGEVARLAADLTPKTDHAGRSLFPNPADAGTTFSDDALRAEDGQEPLSLGSARSTGVSLHVGPGPGGADAAIIDLSFIPLYHPVSGVTGTQRWCPDWSRRRALVLLGRPKEALSGFPERFQGMRFGFGYDCSSADMLAAIARDDAGRRSAAIAAIRESVGDEQYAGERNPPLAAISDARLNLLRFAGQRDRAADEAERWLTSDPGSIAAATQAGEIAFLDGDFDRAHARFAQAAKNFRRRRRADRLGLGEAQLRDGTALAMAGETDAARGALAAADRRAVSVLADSAASTSTDVVTRAQQLAYHARVQAGDAALRVRRYRSAATSYAAAREVWDGVADDGLRPEALANNQAVAEIALQRPRFALRSARAAVRRDRANPIFLMTRGFAEQRLNRNGQAERSYATAARADPTLFPAENDRGVILAGMGRNRDAADAFRRAVGANRRYALGWFNLGVILERLGPRHILASQGSFARAIRLDGALRKREHRLVFDDLPYFTSLDLSKPLPPNWRFADVQRRTPITVVALFVVLLAVMRVGRLASKSVLSRPPVRRRFDATAGRLLRGKLTSRIVLLLSLPLLVWFHDGRVLLNELYTGRVTQRWLRHAGARLAESRWLARTRFAATAVVVTVIALLVPVLRSGPTSATVLVLLATQILVLIAVVVRARRAMADRSATRVENYSWSPSLVLGIVGAGVGVAWAPLPVSHTASPVRRLRWLAPVSLMAIAAAALVVGHSTGVPLTWAFGSWALVMASCISVPLLPLDGGRLTHTRAGMLINLGLFAMGTVLLIGY